MPLPGITQPMGPSETPSRLFPPASSAVTSLAMTYDTSLNSNHVAAHNAANNNNNNNNNNSNNKKSPKHSTELSQTLDTAVDSSAGKSPNACSGNCSDSNSNSSSGSNAFIENFFKDFTAVQKQASRTSTKDQSQPEGGCISSSSSSIVATSAGVIRASVDETVSVTAAASAEAEASSDSSSSCSVSVDIKTECDSSIVVIKTEEDDDGSTMTDLPSTENSDTSDCPATNKPSETISTDINPIFRKPRPVFLSSVNPHIICSLCNGYLVNATTIVECLHSFCHCCIIKHLRLKQYCPRCEMMINTAKPNIKPDTTLQAMVYKLVPGLYEKELLRKRAFYKTRPQEAALASPEQRGEDTEHLIFSPSEYMSLSLEYADTEEYMSSCAGDDAMAELLKPKYLQCPSIFTVAHLKKFVYGKYDISMNNFNIDIMYKVKTIVLLDHYTLMDVAYIYTWKRDAPMRFFFRVKESARPPPAVSTRKALLVAAKEEVLSDNENSLTCIPMTVVHSPVSDEPITATATNATTTATTAPTEIGEDLHLSQIKIEHDTEMVAEAMAATATKTFEIVPQAESIRDSGGTSEHQSKTDKLKITLVSKGSRDKQQQHTSESKQRIETANQNKVGKEKKEHSAAMEPAKDERIRVGKEKKEHTVAMEPPKNERIRLGKEKKEQTVAMEQPKDERKVENIKLKIDLSKQNSVTIINMSDPDRKEIVKPVKAEKEWKVKNKRDKEHRTDGSPKSSPNSERKRKTPSPLTVPPLTIKAERISPLAKCSPKSIPSSPTDSPTTNSNTNTTNIAPAPKTEEDQKSQFLKSFALTPIKELLTKGSLPVNAQKSSPPLVAPLTETIHAPVDICRNSSNVRPQATLMGPPKMSIVPKITQPSKRKSKDPIKTILKKPKCSFAAPTSTTTTTTTATTDDFKIKLPSPPMSVSKLTPTESNTAAVPSRTDDSKLMPAPSALCSMKPPATAPIKKLSNKPTMKFAPPGSLTPHPMSIASLGMMNTVTPGNRTPIAKRYQAILPKTARPNPFANLPNDVNKILKEAGTEIKSIPLKNTNNSRVYGPKIPTTTTTTTTGAPPQRSQIQALNAAAAAAAVAAAAAAQAAAATTMAINSQAYVTVTNTMTMSTPTTAANARNNSMAANGSSSKSSISNYLNMALLNATKSKGNEVPPGCRTPMYTPNSPIYSPSSPQYVPNYNIPTMPSYKYTPKPTVSSSSSFLQNVLGANQQMSSLFPAPPTKKPTAADSVNSTSLCSLVQQQQQHRNTESPQKADQQRQKRVYPFAKSPSPAEDPPEKQLKVKSLLTSCNINIPSSLSITITREDGETSSSHSTYPKHKSPVNNYIEILKLPDQSVDNVDSQKQRSTTNNKQQPQMKSSVPSSSSASSSSSSSVRSGQVVRKDTTTVGGNVHQKPQQQSHPKAVISPPLANSGGHKVSSSSSSVSSANTNTNTNTNTKPSVTIHNITPTASKSVPATIARSIMSTTTKTTTTSSSGTATVTPPIVTSPKQLPLLNPIERKNAKPTPPASPNKDKKTPSPEKKMMTATTTAASAGEGKQSPSADSPTSTTTGAAATSPKLPACADSVNSQAAAKKFRPILPRASMPVVEVVPQKPGDIIGTYTSPAGVPVKIHKAPIRKPRKSPTTTKTTTSPPKQQSPQQSPQQPPQQPPQQRAQQPPQQPSQQPPQQPPQPRPQQQPQQPQQKPPQQPQQKPSQQPPQQQPKQPPQQPPQQPTHQQPKQAQQKPLQLKSNGIPGPAVAKDSPNSSQCVVTTPKTSPVLSSNNKNNARNNNKNKTTNNNSSSSCNSTSNSSSLMQAKGKKTAPSPSPSPPSASASSQSQSQSPSSFAASSATSSPSSSTSPPTTNQLALNKIAAAAQHSNFSVLPGLPGLPGLPAHLEHSAAPPNQADLNKFFNDTLLRAQVQAAAANHQFYPYASAAAAQIGQYGSPVYNYQQAFLLEQFSRMRRAGNEAFEQYMQKLKNGAGKHSPEPSTSTAASSSERKSPAVVSPPVVPTKAIISAPKTSPSVSSPNPQPKPKPKPKQNTSAKSK